LKEEFWTLSIIPHCGKAPKVFPVSRWHLYLMGAVAGILLSILIFLVYSHVVLTAEERNFAEVMAENQALHDHLEKMEERVVSFEERMERVTRAEMQFREIAGLGGIELEVREAGVGGPALSANGHGEGSWLLESTGLRIEATREALSSLERRAELLYQSLVESVDQIEYNHEKYARTPSIWPTKGRISSRYGSRYHPVFGGIRRHEGVDIYAPKGTPIAATADGKVARAGWEVGYGLSMVVDHGYGFRTFYAHCSKLKKNVGDGVERGDIIAMVGSTGITTGSHLHYEVLVDGKSVNPTHYLLGDAVPD
jgi:murein DD-endopeptidase MepM/ murein hydrolase activator NlpD